MNNIDYDAIGQRVESRLVRERNKNLIGLFLANMLMFVIFSVLVWAILPLTNLSFSYEQMDSATLTTLILLSTGWLTGLILHGATALTASGVLDKHLRERLTAQEIQRELRHISRELAQEKTSDKPKRSYDRLRLGEDGELLEITTDNWDEQPEAERTRR